MLFMYFQEKNNIVMEKLSREIFFFNFQKVNIEEFNSEVLYFHHTSGGDQKSKPVP